MTDELAQSDVGHRKPVDCPTSVGRELNEALVGELLAWLMSPGSGEAILVTPWWIPREGCPGWSAGLTWLGLLQERSGAVRRWRLLVHGRRQLRVVALSQGPLRLLDLGGDDLERAWCCEELTTAHELEIRSHLAPGSPLAFVRLAEEASCT